MPNRVIALLLSLMFAWTSSAMIREAQLSDTRSHASGTRYVVEFERTASQQATLQRFRGDFSRIAQPRGTRLLTETQPRIRHEYTKTFFGVAIDTPSCGLADIERLPYVRAIHQDIRFETHATETSATTMQYPVSNTISSGGAGIRVAIIDTGIDYMHPAVGGGFGAGFKVAGGYDFAEDDADPMDIIGHGTHVAGIVAADGPGITGVAPKATLYAYKVFDDRGFGVLSWILAAVERAADPNGDGNTSDHVDIVNMSLGGPGLSDHPLSRAVDAGTDLGIVFCVSAGNSGGTARIMTPGNAASAITVAAVGGRALATFNSGGPAPKTLAFKPDIAAPGELEVRFGNDAADLVAPTLTMMRILDASSAPTNTLANGQKATLLLGAADFHPWMFVVIPLAQSAMKVSYRVNGVWRPLQHVHKATDFERTGRVPAGDIFEVDLSSVTANHNTYVDLKIETTEFGGSSMSWTLSPAFVVGTPPPPPRKRRSAN